MTVSREQLKEAVKNASSEGRLTCEKAHALAKDLEVTLQEIGNICNELNIRIKDCQLGCF